MSKAQRIVLGLGIVAIVALGLFPPWTEIYKSPAGTVQFMSGYGFVLSPPLTVPQGDRITYYAIDYSRLLLLMGIIATATLGGVVLLKKS